MNASSPAQTQVSAPTPLSPDQFSDPAQLPPGGRATSTVMNDISESERATLAYALDMIKAARKDAASDDKKIAASGKGRAISLMCYLMGFGDGRGLTSAPPLKKAFQSAFADAMKPTLETALDEIEASLEQYLSSTDTRLMKEIVNALGDAFLAASGGAWFAPTP
jgi:hypothetical protein